MNGRELECVEVEKELWVFVDMDLKFEQHVNEAVETKNNSQKTTADNA